ncbi:MAG: DUF1549 domain-containing protein [Akkermansiaceae bacterium]|nr:DUF1549 domain-containing protein [Akkermansiaceae bacterium]
MAASLWCACLMTAPAATFQHVRPILEQNCVECHGAEKDKGGLRLDTRAALLEGGDSADAVDLGDPAKSEILRRVTLPHDDDEFMPPLDKEEDDRDPLAAGQVALLEGWIKAGAPWPEKVTLVPRPRTAPTENPDEPDPTLAAIDVYPSDVTLETAADFHRVIVIARHHDATTRDVTASARLQLADPNVARLDGTTLYPQADGRTSLKIAFRGRSAEIPVVVKDAAKPRPISFQLDVMPVLTASGCNTGSCHGSARGQDGFMLSLFGYDPKGDHFRLTREMAGRRINLSLPEESLLVTKATGRVPHTGGKLFEEGSAYHRTLVQWIRDGAPYDGESVALPVGIEVEPKQYVLAGSRVRVPLTVRARYADGTDRDVTTLTSFTTSNDNSVAINESTGEARSKNRGEAFLMGRFHTFTEGAQAIVIPARVDYRKPDLPEFNYIDGHVYNKLHKLRIIPSGLCSDEAFIRRAYLDIVGLLPTEEERAAFLADEDPAKREALVDDLLGRKEFTEMWVMKWAELLQIRSTGNNANQVTYKAALLWYEWLRDRIASNQPFNEIIYDLLTARGGTFKNPATNYYKLENDVKKRTENVAQVFMGTRIQCAQCHNHPFDRWTMDDYYGFASFFSQIRKKRAEDPNEEIVYDAGGEIKHPVTNQNASPQYLGDDTPADTRNKTRREAVAGWLTAPDNPWFARNVSNIVWSHFFGIGIVDPVDDMRISNPATNPELLDALTAKFVEYDFDFRKLVRDICTSRTYQLSTQTNETNAGDDTNFSHSLVRRVRAEVLVDMLAQVTETPNKFRGLPLGARAVQIADGNTTNYVLTTFGRATRATVCSCEVKMEPNLSQALHLLNGNSTHDRIERGKVVETLLKDGKSPAEVIDTVYVRCLGRVPTEVEKSRLHETVAQAKDENDRKEILNDIFWAILNSKEFLFNH